MKLFKRILCCSLALMLGLLPLAVPAAADTPANPKQVTLINETFDQNNPEWEGFLNPSRISYGFADGAAWITDSGWSSLYIVPAAKLQGVSEFTVSMKVKFTTLNGSQTTLFGLVYCNDDTTGTFNKNSGAVIFRSNSGGAVYLLNGGYVNQTLNALETDGSTLRTSAHNNASYFPQLSAYTDGAADVGNWVTVSVAVNRNAKTAVLSINGTEVNTYSNLPAYESGIQLLLQQNSRTAVDDLSVTDGSGKSLYSADFSAPAANSLNLTDETGTSRLTQTATVEGLRLSDSGWCIYQLASKAQLAGATSYTLSAKIRVETFTGADSQLSFRFGLESGAATNGINRATNVQIYGTSFQIIGGNRNSSGWVKSGDGAQVSVSSNNSVQTSRAFDLTMTVDNANATCRLVISNGTASAEQTFEHIYTNDSNLAMVFQNQAAVLHNIKLTATYGADVDLLGAQVTTAVTDTYGIRFSSRIRTDSLGGYGAAGIRVVAEYGDGQTKTFTEGEGQTVYRSILGNEAGVAKTYRATDYGAAYLFCVTITDIPVDAGTITFTVTPYLRDLEGHAVEGSPAVFTVNAGVIQ